MRAAAQFIKQLQEGKTTEAITTLKTSLFESTATMIEESRTDVITSYGFQLDEKKKVKEEEEKDSKDDESDEDESEDDDSEDKEEKEDKGE